jgi:amino acid adenylation domain-containing protein
MLSHRNVLHNSTAICETMQITPESIGVSWLPPYHDMGLIGALLQPVYSGFRCVLMSPVDFLQRPLRWLQAISHYRATHSGGPNFAYDLCARKVTPEQRAALDLSTWAVAFNGAEPVRAETLERFAATFALCGFQAQAFLPCFGLAEGTLLVSGARSDGAPLIGSFQKVALERGQVAVATNGDAAQTLVGSGRVSGGQRVAIVDPETRTLRQHDQIGEIWVAGESVAQGYWKRPEATEQTFRASIADTGEGSFLRTGDLGFLRTSELFITGRLKDLIVIRGRNLYPQDIELTAERSHPALRPGCNAAFSVDREGEERLVVVQEIDTAKLINTEAVASAMRRAVADAHDVQIGIVALVAARSISKTSSGKIQRHACKAEFLGGTLETVGVSALVHHETPPAGALNTSGDTATDLILSAEPGVRQALVQNFLRSRAAPILKIDLAQLDPQAPLTVQGLDSLSAVELADEIESELGVSVTLAHLLRGDTLTHIADQVLDALAPHATRPSPVAEPAYDAETEHPVSYGQRALWFLQQLAPDSAAYNIVNAVRVRKAIDVHALRRTFQRIIERHEALRTTFADRDGEPVQIVHPRQEVCFQHIDVSGWSDAALNERVAEEVYRPFDLQNGPLLRTYMFTRAPEDHILMAALHHSVTDLWSLALLLYEIGEIYAAEKLGRPITLKAPAAQYADHVRRQRERLAGPEGERLWAYWQTQLAGDLPTLDLPTDRPRPPAQTYHGATQTTRLSTELTTALRELAHAQGATLFTVVLAAFQTLLYRYTGQEDLLIGSPRAARQRQMARSMGYFVNMVVLRANLSGAPTFAELLKQAHETVTASFEHGDFPFSLLVERLQPARDLSRPPLFQVVFGWQKTTGVVDNQTVSSWALSETGTQLRLNELPMEAWPLADRPIPVDLTLLMAEAGDELAATIEYTTDLFDADTIARLLGHFQTLLSAAAADPSAPISALPLLTPAEQQQLLVEWNSVTADYSIDHPVHYLFEEQVSRTPAATALEWDGGQMSYRTLNARANRLAHYLRRVGIGPETLVGIYTGRSPEMIVGVLGVLKAGGAFLPLDPSYPPERLRFMLDDARPPVLLTTTRDLRLTTDDLDHDDDPRRVVVNPTSKIINLDADWLTIATAPDNNPEPGSTAEDLAYVIYTSGSTGTPKGAMLRHCGLSNLALAQINGFGVTAASRVLQFASFSFDAAISELFMALLSGATLCLMRREEQASPAEISRLLREMRITVVTLPPSLLGLLEPEELDGVRTVISAGERLPTALAERWKRGRRFFNAYGPTEATIGPTLYEVKDLPPGATSVPIGRPIPNVQIYLLDRNNQPVPIGVPGEIAIGGAGVARGYLNRPVLTSERFADFRFWILDFRGESAAIQNRVYKTGDQARYLKDGNIEFLGRLDQQIKLRGFRIELGEIEAVLRRHPAIREVCVQARTDAVENERLVAYVVCDATDYGPLFAELRAELREHLPEYMTPSLFVPLATLPRTPNGKIDRQTLPAPDQTRPALETEYVAPRTPVEQTLADIWAQTLGIERVGIYDNFFALGGHSLLATQLLARVRTAFHIDVQLQRFFTAPTITAMAVAIAQQQAEQEDSEQIDTLLAEIEQLSDDEARELLVGQSGQFKGASL